MMTTEPDLVSKSFDTYEKLVRTYLRCSIHLKLTQSPEAYVRTLPFQTQNKVATIHTEVPYEVRKVLHPFCKLIRVEYSDVVPLRNHYAVWKLSDG